MYQGFKCKNEIIKVLEENTGKFIYSLGVRMTF